MNVLLDTCVLIDSMQQRKPFCEESNKIILAAANRILNGFITAKSVADIYYLTHRYTHSDERSRKILSTVFSLFTVCDTTSSDCINALSSLTSDYEDAIMIETARRESMDCIVTRNMKDYQNSPIAVFSPAQLIEKLQLDDIG